MADRILDLLKSKSLSHLDAEEMREARELAWSILRADYWSDVRGIADSVREAIKDGEVTDDSELSDRIWEECDGSARIIYTARAMEVLLISDNADAYVEEMGSLEDVANGDSIRWEVLAFYAFCQDVQEEIGTIDFDADSEDSEDADETL